MEAKSPELKGKDPGVYTLPNIITLFRFALVPVFLILFLSPLPGLHLVASALFVLAALSDALDGWLARVLEQQTPFGRLADPLADKLLSVSVILALLIRDLPMSDPGLARVAIFVIVGTEILIATISGISHARGIAIRPAMVGRVKTVVQFLTLLSCLLLLNLGGDLGLLPPTHPWQDHFLTLAFALSALLTVSTLIVYIARYPDHRAQLSLARQQARDRAARRREHLQRIVEQAPGRPRRQEALRAAREIARDLSGEGRDSPASGKEDSKKPR